MNQKPSALLIGEIIHAQKEWEACGALVNLKEYRRGSRDDFLQKLQRGEYADVVVIYRSNDSTKISGPFDEELVKLLPRALKYVCHNGAGYDNIDITACTRRDISVASTPVAVNDATADTAMFLLLGSLRRIANPFLSVRQDGWRGKGFQLGHDPKGKVLGILGMGGIGQAVAHRARAFGMEIQYHNRRQLRSDQAGNAKYVSFDELLATSDVLSLNLSLTPATRHFIGMDELAKMKDGIIIINTARGPIIDEDELVKALDSGKVWSVGLDVFEDEPKIHPGLMKHPHAVLLPHVGTATFETQRDMELLVLENLKSAVTKGVLLTQVPEQRKPREVNL